MKYFRVSLVCNFPFPQGLAATTRIVAYMKGLVEHGVKTDVFVNSPTEVYCKNKTDIPNSGIYQGISYQYTYKKMYSKHKFIRVLTPYFAPFYSCRKIYQENGSQKINFLLINTDYLYPLFIFTLWAKLIGIKPIFITDEYPEPMRTKLKPRISKLKKWMYNSILRHEDAFIFMTDKLNVYYNSKFNKPYHILPTITDTTRFEVEVEEKIDSNPYLCYMGNMELAKDNITNIIDAFALITNKYPDLSLHLYGQPSTENLNIIKKAISKHRLEKKIEIKGRCNYEQVPSILKQAHVLVSSQPITKRAEGGFPTKLGEYLATGIPTILTDVGEISLYVEDNTHVFLVPPENPEAYADKLDYILSNYDHSLNVAEMGRELVVQRYDYKVISKLLLLFLKRLQ